MTGKTIQEITEGYLHDNECLIFKMTDGTMFLLRSGSSSSDGILSCEQIAEIPAGFCEIKLNIL